MNRLMSGRLLLQVPVSKGWDSGDSGKIQLWMESKKKTFVAGWPLVALVAGIFYDWDILGGRS